MSKRRNIKKSSHMRWWFTVFAVFSIISLCTEIGSGSKISASEKALNKPPIIEVYESYTRVNYLVSDENKEVIKNDDVDIYKVIPVIIALVTAILLLVDYFTDYIIHLTRFHKSEKGNDTLRLRKDLMSFKYAGRTVLAFLVVNILSLWITLMTKCVWGSIIIFLIDVGLLCNQYKNWKKYGNERIVIKVGKEIWLYKNMLSEENYVFYNKHNKKLKCFTTKEIVNNFHGYRKAGKVKKKMKTKRL